MPMKHSHVAVSHFTVSYFTENLLHRVEMMMYIFYSQRVFNDKCWDM